MSTKAQSAISNTPRIYTYARFSSLQQADGSSIARQDAYAEAWAKQHGLILDRSLRMEDRGKSAHKGEHVKKGGALGAFIERIKAGDVVPGDTLIVENLDRLSRQSAQNAQTQFNAIVNTYGVDIVTMHDGVRYNREELARDPSPLFLALAVMVRAYDESSRKSSNARGAYRDKCERWLKGEYHGLIGQPRHIRVSDGKLIKGTDPIWILYDTEAKRFELVPEKAAAMQRIIDLYRQGHGSVEITRRMETEGLTISDKRAVVRIHKLITYPALKGDKVVVVDGQTYTLKGYYPPLITETEFDELQLLVGKRGVRKGKGKVPAILTGMKMCYCGYCRQLMVGQTLTTTRADGTTHQYFRRLRCGSYANRAADCRGGASCSGVPVEKAIMTFCANQMNLNHLFTGNDKSDPLMRQLTAKRASLAKTDLKLKGIKDEMLNGDALPSTFREVLRELETNKRTLTQAITKLERELSINSAAQPAPAETWADLVSDVMALDYDARMKTRRLVQETFERIDVFSKGFECDGEHMAVRVTSKRGVVMGFEFNRRTGELIEATRTRKSKPLPKPARTPRMK
ncbi:recombinase family protein [Paraburkholderia sp. MM5384-R2]|uniref:recombinase family protein n=1 Tax=Paraburkholderia sp. MM5384-R2 TaxID=2723097 RepID=UPI001607ADFD|nr:recombinase family protein [Paraburkholderia sp. MM5384-R2]MBB5496895.1 DNA invertase Pin-like site-specific DNA recombinase [Paraburkholderia sp. MM5384-R2]